MRAERVPFWLNEVILLCLIVQMNHTNTILVCLLKIRFTHPGVLTPRIMNCPRTIEKLTVTQNAAPVPKCFRFGVYFITCQPHNLSRNTPVDRGAVQNAHGSDRARVTDEQDEQDEQSRTMHSHS